MKQVRNIIAILLLLLCIASFVELLHNTREDLIIFLLFTMCSSAILAISILSNNETNE